MVNTDKYIWLVVGLIITFVAISGFWGASFLALFNGEDSNERSNNTSNSYTNEDFKLSFSYPDNYILTTHETQKRDDQNVSLVLVIGNENKKILKQEEFGLRNHPILIFPRRRGF